MNIPKTPQEITVPLLKEALKDQAWSQHIASFAFEANDLQGRCSNVLKFTISFDDGSEPRDLYLKFARADDQPQGSGIDRDHLVEIGAYRKEVAFYQYLMAIKSDLLTKKIVPPIFYAAIDKSQKDQFLLIMGKSGNSIDQIKGCSLVQANNVMGKWAQVQAHFWHTSANQDKLLAELKAHGLDMITPSYIPTGSIIDAKKNYANKLDELLADVVKNWPTKWEQFVAVMKHFAAERSMQRLLDNFEIANKLFHAGKATDLVKECFKVAFQSDHNTFCHCDFRLDNMLEDGDDIQVIDFQSYTFGNGTYDVAHFVAQSISPEQLEAHFDELMETYYNSLVKCNPSIATNYTLEKLKYETKITTMLQLLMLSFHLASFKDMLDKGMDLPKMMGRWFDLIMSITDRIVHCFVHFFK